MLAGYRWGASVQNKVLTGGRAANTLDVLRASGLNPLKLSNT